MHSFARCKKLESFGDVVDGDGLIGNSQEEVLRYGRCTMRSYGYVRRFWCVAKTRGTDTMTLVSLAALSGFERGNCDDRFLHFPRFFVFDTMFGHTQFFSMRTACELLSP